MPDFSLRDIEQLPDLPTEGPISEGQYVVKPTGEETVLASEDTGIASQVWFESNPLRLETIQRIKSIQLFAESHDQGVVDDKDAGNWTWFDIAILGGPAYKSTRSKDGVELVWRSHTNRFQTTEYEWKEGNLFGKDHEMVRLVEEGNVLAIRLCARYKGWKIFARGGYLQIEIGGKPIDREPVNYGSFVSEIKCINDTIQEINGANNAAFSPKLPQTLFRAGGLSIGGDGPIHGGGVRGLASLHMLKAVMDKAAPGKKPCQVFNMIGGTSTGGLIAIMLGRLEMTVENCINKYTNIINDVFHGSEAEKDIHFAWDGQFHDASILEKKIKEVIRETLNADPETVPLYNERGPCRIFCMAVRRDAANNHGPVFLRSYINPQEKSVLLNIKIWEAARATSAAPAYFAPIKVGKYELVDGGLEANNPLGWLWTEVLGVFGPTRTTDCFLSIGTGVGRNVLLPKPTLLPSHELEMALSGIATNTQMIHILFKALLNSFAPEAQAKKYWRLNIATEIPEHFVTKTTFFGQDKEVLDDFENVGDLDDVVAVKDLVEKAKVYIKDQSSMIDECAQALSRNLH